ncbi:MAG: type 4a pilus biogenesis protein PilO [Pyrinomonadaceae bacterium]|nr:type 4a pilus biogenesis protein PilO [Pyrinomonadaceae bacterium]
MEKLKSLAWHWQLVILISFGAIVYLMVWYFVTSGTRAEIQAVNDQVAQLRARNQAAKIATQRINEFRTLYATKEEEYDELKVLLPEQREITNVLQGLQDTARESRLIVNRFSPRDDSQQDFIMAKPVEVEVDSNFNNLRDFFDKMAKLQRIVSITDFSLKQLEKQSAGKTLHAQFLLTAYYASPDDLDNIASPVQIGPDGKPVLGPDGKPLPAAPAPGAPAPGAPVPGAPAAPPAAPAGQ